MNDELEFIEKAIENAVENPKKAKEDRAKKLEMGEEKGIMDLIFGFIKSYKEKGNLSDKEWLEKKFSEHGVEKPDAVAQEFVQDVEGYENAKKSLKTHLELGGTREEWLGEQIEIGAANAGKSPAEYAEKVSEGLEEAACENHELLLNTEGAKEEK